MPPANTQSRRLTGQTMTREHAVRLVGWASTLHEFPSVQAICARWECSRASAYRWRAALADGFGIAAPPNPPGTDVSGPREAPLHSRRSS